VTRIISGYLGSMQLKAAAKATRPTSDRVKESLFAKLDAMGVLEGAEVLDLFAGTGALGIEAASRGAKRVKFVEQDRTAHGLLTQNIASANQSFSKQGVEAHLDAQNLDAKKFLKNTTGFFDLVFIDPPYEFANSDLTELIELLTKNLNSDALVVIERSSRSEKPDLQGVELLSEKSYGDTAVWIYQKS
jgi:16S rRNA (guanine966-N2)-methyltransferase